MLSILILVIQLHPSNCDKQLGKYEMPKVNKYKVCMVKKSC